MVTKRAARSQSRDKENTQERIDRRPGSGGRIYTVDTSRARTNTECVRLVIEKLGWKEYPEGRSDGRPCDIYWHAIVHSDLKDIVQSGKVNKFPGMNELSRKVSLTRCLKTMQKLFPHQYDFYPKSWFIPAQVEEFYEDYYARLEQNVGGIPWYIAKPDQGSQGTGIYLIHTPEQLQSPNTPQLIQEYVVDPFLFKDKLKFDLRVYATIKSLNPLTIYVAREGMARFCTAKYRAPDITNSSEVYMHLTNYSLNKTSENYVNSDSGSEGNKRLLSTVFHQMEAQGIKTRKIWHNIKLIIVKTVIAMIPETIIHYEGQYGGAVGPACFQILGFDIMLNSSLQPILIEVNACPSLTLSAPAKEGEAPKQSMVDFAIKVPLVLDTMKAVAEIQPMRLRSAVLSAKMSKDDSFCGDNFNLSEVFPATYGHSCQSLLILHRAAYLYLHFTSVKRSLFITMSGCRNLIRKCNLGDQMTIAELDEQYAKIQNNWDGHNASGYISFNNSGITVEIFKGLPFNGFVDILIALAMRKFPSAKNLTEALKSLLHFCELQLRYHGVGSAKMRDVVEDNKNNQETKDIYLLPNRASAQRKNRQSMLPKI